MPTSANSYIIIRPMLTCYTSLPPVIRCACWPVGPIGSKLVDCRPTLSAGLTVVARASLLLMLGLLLIRFGCLLIA